MGRDWGRDWDREEAGRLLHLSLEEIAFEH